MQNIDWKNLPFGYFKTDYNVRAYWKNGEWGKIEITDSEFITLHMAATALHYGQEAFEGMKAFRGKDNKIRVFRWEENSKRLNRSADGIMMQPVPAELFKEAMTTVIKKNEKYVPPFGTGASLYIRPLLIGSGPQVGVKPAKEYMFMIFVGPVGPYFKEGFNPVSAQIVRDYDRAAPLGTGSIKVGGNYAASLRAGERAHDEGYSTAIFLDAIEKKYIDEAGPANFFAIKGNKYITPESHSILPSITNMSLIELARDMGLTVERRRIAVEELADFDEVGACGTAAVISPIKKIFDRDIKKTYEYCKDGVAGPISTKLYKRLQGIQSGEEEDKFKWNLVIE
ncbi:MAG TPA: branched-chain amino acid aminotransferase [Bacteroidales bacterium]|nr:branched-chain amino acid aminotransferase [Bacteroidales bacterium]HPS18319.1 branched-chain amino acid aminotransferase [Bacteroidales bacterium]